MSSPSPALSANTGLKSLLAHFPLARLRWAALFCLLILGTFLAPATPFIIDGGIYADMARAMAEQGALHIGGNGGVEGAPALTKYLTHARDSLVYPQYPSGYALLAAPFYMAFGLRGLMLMNALSFGVCLLLTLRIAEWFYGPRIARWAAAIFALATFAPTYVFPIWPHMVSLAFWLGAVFFAVKAADAAGRKSAYGFLMAAGALIGAGINIRIDAVLLAGVIFVWLRAFARPEDRLAPLALALGMVPGLLLAAMLNGIKFGAFTPFTYGSSGGVTGLSHYTAVIIAAAVVMTSLWAFNLRTVFLRARQVLTARQILSVCAAGLLSILMITPLREMAWRIVKGLYVLIVNLQAHDAYYQAGVERNEYGQLLFWGYPKKALVQSLPYLPLIALPAFYSLRGKNVSAVALCLLAIAAPVAFYALNQWHGGGCYSLRYFTPALPFIAILAAAALGDLADKARAEPSQTTLLVLIAAAAVFYLLMQEIAGASERLRTPVSLYPQWLIAGVVIAALAAHLRTPASQGRARLALYASLAALAYAAAINIYEEFGHEKTRAEQLAVSRDAAAPIPPSSLVLSHLPIMFLQAEAKGAFVMTVTDENAPEAAEAATAFLKAGRCVYFHKQGQREMTAPFLAEPVSSEPIWAPSKRFGRESNLAFYIFESQRAQCAF